MDNDVFVRFDVFCGVEGSDYFLFCRILVQFCSVELFCYIGMLWFFEFYEYEQQVVIVLEWLVVVLIDDELGEEFKLISGDKWVVVVLICLLVFLWFYVYLVNVFDCYVNFDFFQLYLGGDVSILLFGMLILCFENVVWD